MFNRNKFDVVTLVFHLLFIIVLLINWYYTELQVDSFFRFIYVAISSFFISFAPFKMIGLEFIDSKLRYTRLKCWRPATIMLNVFMYFPDVSYKSWQVWYQGLQGAFILLLFIMGFVELIVDSVELYVQKTQTAVQENNSYVVNKDSNIE